MNFRVERSGGRIFSHFHYYGYHPIGAKNIPLPSTLVMHLSTCVWCASVRVSVYNT